jgi:hypothetical protein
MEVSLLAGRNIAVTDSVLFGLEVEAGYGRTALGEAASGAFNDFYGTLRASTTFAANDIAQAQVRLDWRAAARARIGYLATPDLLLFAGAGPALAQARRHSSLPRSPRRLPASSVPRRRAASCRGLAGSSAPSCASRRRSVCAGTIRW